MTGTVNSIVTGRNRDCMSCRIVSGCGLIGSGIYVSHHTKKLQKNASKSAMYIIASALLFLGTTRLLDLPPFRKQFSRS